MKTATVPRRFLAVLAAALIGTLAAGWMIGPEGVQDSGAQDNSQRDVPDGAGASAPQSDEALITAAKRGDVDQIRELLDRGVDVNSRTRYGATALTFAAERGHLEAVRLLIESGADVNVQDDFYHASPLTWALQGGHTEVAELLREHGGQRHWGRRDATRQAAAEPAAEVDQGEQPADELELSDDPHAADRAVSSPHWPQFRGLGARGVAEGQRPPIQWNVETGEGVRWKTPIPGLGHSAPVIWGDKLFVTTAHSASGGDDIRIGLYGDVDSVEDDSIHTYIVYCLDKHTGEIVWQQTAAEGVPKVRRHLKSTHANPSCATDGRFVVALFPDEGLFCYTLEGRLVWHLDLGYLDSGWFYDADYQWGFAASPIIYQDMVIVQCDIQLDSFIAAFSLSTGREIWRTERDEIPTWSTPTVHETASGPLLITNGTNAIRGYDARDGELLWELSPSSEIAVPTPIVAHQLVFVASGYRPIQPIYAISLDARGDISLEEEETANEAIAWSTMRHGPYMPTPIVYGDFLYTCSNQGIIACYHAKTGRQLYRERLATGGSLSFSASPVAADGHLYFAAEDGRVVVVRAGDTQEIVSVNPTGESVLATPAISEGVFYLRTSRHVIALEAVHASP